MRIFCGNIRCGKTRVWAGTQRYSRLKQYELTHPSFGIRIFCPSAVQKFFQRLNPALKQMLFSSQAVKSSGSHHATWTPSARRRSRRSHLLLKSVPSNSVLGLMTVIPWTWIFSTMSVTFTKHINLLILTTILDSFEQDASIDVTDFMDLSEWKLLSTNGEKHEKIYPCCEEPYVSPQFLTHIFQLNFLKDLKWFPFYRLTSPLTSPFSESQLLIPVQKKSTCKFSSFDHS